ncbi:MAG: DNA repair protein RecN [Lachnospiraceae bacterium]|nr:DNA repair protein RecN [Lachnospiraceae bacterium]
MLLNIHVKNMALIEEIEVDFAEHLNILSGETGAGKSILLGSVNAALGAKVSKDMIRKDAEYGMIELVFSVERQEIIDRIRSLDIPVDEDGIVIISRKIMKNRSISKINGETVTLSILKEVSSLLIDIHGQHEHQSLLNKKIHLEIIDSYGKKDIEPVKAQVAEAYCRYKALEKELKAADIDEEERLREISFLEFEIQEIEQARLMDGEDELLEKDYKKMCNSRVLMESAGEVYRMLGYDESHSVGSILGRAVRQFSSVTRLDEEASSMGEQLEQLDSLCNDLNRELSDYLMSLEFDDEAFKETEDRINLIHTLKSKYGNTIDKIKAYLNKQKARLNDLTHLEERIQELSYETEKARQELDSLCAQLSKLRTFAGGELAAGIKEALIDLNFLDVAFETAFTKMNGYTADGYDEACFMISTNPGENLKPLPDIASGGELSRIMLAIKSILAKVDTIDTLIFDEIDVGISGRTAQMVSEKMSHIARNHQVIAITHLPQIAAMADSHYFIEKKAEDTKTTTSIIRLSREGSVKELARMLGGVEITDSVLVSANEMKDMAEKVKSY